MPIPTTTVDGSLNPLSGVTLPRNALINSNKPWSTYSGLAASTTYALENTPLDAEPALYALVVNGVAEAGLLYHPGASAAIVKIGGSTNIVVGASPGSTQISLHNNSGVLEIRTGSGTLVGTTVHLKRID
jgi:hypothetical protein